MPGFLSLYDGVDRIQIDDLSEWWVDIKRALSVADSEDAERALLDIQIGEGTTKATVDPTAKQFEQVLASIVKWNLTDRAGNVLPVAFDRAREKAARDARDPNWMSPLRKSLLQIPQQVYDQLSLQVGKRNGPKSRAEEARFPNGSNGSPALGEDAPPDDRQVLERGAVPSAPGGPGGPAPTA